MRSLLLITVCLLSVEWSSAGIQVPKRPGPALKIPGLGSVKGLYGTSYVKNRTYSKFLGIRYAKAPSKSLRFQPPEFEGPWNGILPAQIPGQKCPQTGIVKGETSERDPRNWHAAVEERMEKAGILEELRLKDKEDCLFIHIYTPDVNASLPVMVFFHGGAFAGGSANVYGGDRFMDKDVVLVVPHYRLGPLSFLSLHTDKIAGNAGLLDQVLALKWVQKHISVFGGNPNEVTIFGESAGAASVSYLMISPLAKGLFSRVIAESGSALADWAIDLDPVYNTVNIAKIAGCNQQQPDGTPDIPGIANCLMAVDAMVLTKAYQTYKGQQEKEGRTGFGGCSPIIQKAGKLKYIDRHPEDYLKTGDYSKVPIMFGSNRDEGTYVLAIVYNGYMRPNNLVNDTDFLNYRMTDVALSLFNTKDPNYWLVDAVEERFEPHEARGNFYKMMPALIDTLGAAFLKGPTYRVVQYNSKYEESYHYTFNYKGNRTLWSMIGDPNGPFKGGICHSNELLYIFSIPLNDIVTDTDKSVSKRMIDLWTNFATYGNPTPKGSPIPGVPTWPKYSEEEKPFLQIMEDFTIEHNFTKQYTIDVDEGMTDA